MRLPACLFLALLPAFADAAAGPAPLALAISRGLDRLAAGARAYAQRRDCFSCHHQALTISCAAAAQRAGFAVPADLVKEQATFTLDSFRTKLERVRKGQGVPGGNTMAAYALFALDEAGHAPDGTTAALADYLVARQKSDGSWPALMPRPPSEGSPFTNAALALPGLARHGKGKAAQEARSKGIAWLEKAEPRDTEDRAWQVRALAGLGHGGTGAAKRELLKLRRKDGGWAQLPSMDSDAYATGLSLMALRAAGMPATDDEFRDGVAWLLRSQEASGAWIVKTRSRPVQTWFDNGDPGGKSQFITFLATGWAVRCLLEAATP